MHARRREGSLTVLETDGCRYSDKEGELKKIRGLQEKNNGPQGHGKTGKHERKATRTSVKKKASMKKNRKKEGAFPMREKKKRKRKRSGPIFATTAGRIPCSNQRKGPLNGQHEREKVSFKKGEFDKQHQGKPGPRELNISSEKVKPGN